MPLTKETNHEDRARNQLTGEVEIRRGTVVGEVKFTIPRQSLMTLESIDDVDLKKGDKVRVIVTATHALLIKW
jgi:molybdopterin-binding protein